MKLNTELLPVPPEYVDKFWRGACRVALRKIPGYDQNRTHQRLLIGLDTLWVACAPVGCPSIWGVVITSLSERPPSPMKCFQRKNPALMRSLTVHVAGEYVVDKWIDSAIERITRYAREMGCRQLFLIMRKGYQRWFTRPFFSRGWEAMGIARDRSTKSKCEAYRRRNTPGHFRVVMPMPSERFTRHMYRMTDRFYLKEVA